MTSATRAGRRLGLESSPGKENLDFVFADAIIYPALCPIYSPHTVNTSKLPRDLLHHKGLKDIANLDVVKILNTNTAFIAALHFPDIILESFQ